MAVPTTPMPKGFHRALTLFKEAACRVPAYKSFLKKHRVNAVLVKTPSDFAQIPTIDKSSYVSEHSLQELSWDGVLSNARYIAASSGSTGEPFYWPRGSLQDEVSSRLYQRILENIFGTKKDKTLCLNLFALGSWIAGIEFYNAIRWSAERGSNIVLVNASIEKASALDALRRLPEFFDRIVLAGYPPFIKDVLELAASKGFIWKRLDVRLITAGETISESWREHVLKILGKPGSLSNLINVYGMAETGVVAAESPLTIAARRSAAKKHLLPLVYESGVASLYQYDPMTRYFETDSDGTLLVTSNSGLPLIRYSTRDQGGLLSYSDLLSHLEERIEKTKTLNFPALYLHGRRDLSISFYGLNIYVENIKRALEGAPSRASCTELFTMGVTHTKNLDQRLEITLELSSSYKGKGGANLKRALTEHLVRTLRKVNSEYAKLYSMLGERAAPHVRLVPYGEIHTVPGKKHKWISRK